MAKRRNFLQAAATLLTFGMFEQQVMASVGVQSPTELMIERNGGMIYHVRGLDFDNFNHDADLDGQDMLVLASTLTEGEAIRVRDILLRDAFREVALSDMAPDFADLLGYEPKQVREMPKEEQAKITVAVAHWFLAAAEARDDREKVKDIKEDMAWFAENDEEYSLWDEPYGYLFEDLTVEEAHDLHQFFLKPLFKIESVKPESKIQELESKGEEYAEKIVEARCVDKNAKASRYSEEEILKRYRKARARLAAEYSQGKTV